ncbi:MAG: hypothetical protein VW687_01270 [Curvibacter sp.]
MNRFLMTVVLALAGVAGGPAWAHGEVKARHGGQVQEAQDLGFELVQQPAGVALYIDDHGKPLAPAGLSGKLTVLAGGVKTDYPLGVAGDRLLAAGAQLPKGARAVAVINGVGGKTVTVRYTIK